MAQKKDIKQEKSNVEDVVNQSTSSNIDLDELKTLMQSMKAEMESMKDQIDNKDKEKEILLSQIQDLKNTKAQDNYENFVKNSDSDFITIIHLIEPPSGCCTYIQLSDVTRELREMGATTSFSKAQFEELKGKYIGFFNNGIIAIEARSMKYGIDNNLPVFDADTKKIYNREKLSEVGKYTKEELARFFEGLSPQYHKSFLIYWLRECYNKNRDFYDRDKMNLLSRLANTNVFDVFVLEINNEEQSKM